MNETERSIHTAAAPTRCNKCGKTFTEWDRYGDFSFEKYVGYGSRHDFEHVKVQFCCECFDALLDRLIAECKINPVVGTYDLDGDSEWSLEETGHE